MTARIFGIAGSTNSAEDFRLSAGGIFVPASALNDRTGVTSVPALTGTGSLTATVGPFSCLIDGTSNSLQGSYWVTLDAAATITITAGNTQARIDLISMQILDNAYDGSGQQKAQLVVTAGVPSGSPVAPAAPANSISLWTLPVPALATTITFSTATAVFPYTAAVGGIVPVRNASDKPAAVNGLAIRYRMDVTAGTGASPLETSVDGNTFTPVSDPNTGYGTWTNLTLSANWATSSNTPQYRTAPGNRFELRGAIVTTGAVTSGTIAWTAGPTPTVSFRYLDWDCIVNAATGYFQVNSSGTGQAALSSGTTIASGSIISLDGMSFSA